MNKKENTEIAFFENRKIIIFHLLIVFFIIFLNLGVSAFIRSMGLFYVPNENPIGYQFGFVYSILILSFILWLLAYFKIYIKHPIITFLITGGAISNFLEKWVFYNSVTDYIQSGFGYFNLADIQIWIGIISLNIYVWFIDDNINKENKITN